MSETVNTFLLAGDECMSEMHLKQPILVNKPEFTYSACGPFTKNKERIQKLKVTGDKIFLQKWTR